MIESPSLEPVLSSIRHQIPDFFRTLSPESLVLEYLRKNPPPPDHCRPWAILSLGKASTGLTLGLASHFHVSPGHTLTILPQGYPPPPSHYPVLFGPHPVPDVASQETLAQIRGFIKKIPETAEMIVAISGGTSSIIADPVPFVTISDKARVTRDLIDSGAPIEVINSLRIHLSRIKGGGLAELIAPRKSLYYVFSDIPGEDPTLVGSAPMTRIDREGGSALSALNFWLKGTVPKSVSAALENRERLYHPDPSGQNEPFFGGAIASSETLLARAREIFLAHDLYDDSRVHILTDRLGGEAREAGIVLSSLVLWHSRQSSQRSAWLAAGETTVRLPSNIAGKGGRSLELGLSLALELRKQRAIVLSLASDGWDGNSGLAGTLIATGLLDPAPMCRDAMEALASHNTGPFLRTHAMAVETGPTGSNLNDLLLVLLNP